MRSTSVKVSGREMVASVHVSNLRRQSDASCSFLQQGTARAESVVDKNLRQNSRKKKKKVPGQWQNVLALEKMFFASVTRL